MLANIPVVLFLVIRGIPDEDEISEDYLFMTVMLLKNLRLAHANEVSNVLRTLIEILSDKFIFHRYFFLNLLSWSLAILKFIMSIHYMACGWIFIYNKKRHYGYDHIKFPEEGYTEVYVDAIYTMTSTISTVGYGDYKGFIDNQGDWSIEMIYLVLIIPIGLLVYTLIVN